MTGPETASRALEKLIGGLESRIRAAAARYSLDAADVEEVIQDVRIRIWKARGDGAGIEGTSAGYVYRTTLSAALDLIRRRRRRGTEALSPALSVADPDHPERALESRELGAVIAQAIETLSERRRPVVRMYLAGYGSGEIAQLLGWTEAKARNLLYRGLDDLRMDLSARGIGPATSRGGESPGPSRAYSGMEEPDDPSAPPRGGGEP